MTLPVTVHGRADAQRVFTELNCLPLPLSGPLRESGSVRKIQAQAIKEIPGYTVSTSELEGAESVSGKLPNQREEELLRPFLKS